MMGVLGPIASDPRMVNSQLQQVQVLRDEFTAQKAQLTKFNNCGSNLCQAIEPSSPELKKVEDKLNAVNSKWEDLLGRLDERKNSLDAAAGTSKDFNAIMNKVMDVL